ncbi:hypothetical protein V502_01977 [Pseudogymnoascus sp. VKM F-4520 (FW-2644)]|nr:hypothetical protein V502_01977 [Pseudogymnoascus sp. VKM F-4520 (FW-2644)]
MGSKWIHYSSPSVDALQPPWIYNAEQASESTYNVLFCTHCGSAVPAKQLRSHLVVSHQFPASIREPIIQELHLLLVIQTLENLLPLPDNSPPLSCLPNPIRGYRCPSCHCYKTSNFDALRKHLNKEHKVFHDNTVTESSTACYLQRWIQTTREKSLGSIMASAIDLGALEEDIDAHFAPQIPRGEEKATKKPHGLSKATRERIKQDVAQIEGLIPNPGALQQSEFPFPPPKVAPIPAFRVIQDRCDAICKSIAGMFISGKVKSREDGPERATSDPTNGDTDRSVQGGQAGDAEGVREGRGGGEPSDQAKQPSPWLRRVGCIPHLAGIDRKVDEEEEPHLAIMCTAFEWLIQDAQYKAVREVVGQQALFEANKKEVEKETNMPV